MAVPPKIGPNGPTGVTRPGRRPSESWIPIPATRKGRGATGQAVQEGFDFDLTGERRETNTLINDLRREVERWRLSYAGVTPISRKLLQHWSDPARGEERVLFCQREAVETAIFLAEVAGRGRWKGADWRRRLDEANAVHNAGLPRTALKMATGSGKTVVMAHAHRLADPQPRPRPARCTVHQPLSRRHARDHDPRPPAGAAAGRRRELLPLRDLVPADLWGALHQARVVITNYHSFLPRDRREIKGVASTTRKILVQGRTDPFAETPDDVVSRVLRDLGGSGTKGGARLMVLNDEAHHCYQDQPPVAEDPSAATLDAEARERNVEARVCSKGCRPSTGRSASKASTTSPRRRSTSGARATRRATSSRGRSATSPSWMRSSRASSKSRGSPSTTTPRART